MRIRTYAARVAGGSVAVQQMDVEYSGPAALEKGRANALLLPLVISSRARASVVGGQLPRASVYQLGLQSASGPRGWAWLARVVFVHEGVAGNYGVKDKNIKGIELH